RIDRAKARLAGLEAVAQRNSISPNKQQSSGVWSSARSFLRRVRERDRQFPLDIVRQINNDMLSIVGLSRGLSPGLSGCQGARRGAGSVSHEPMADVLCED